MFNRELMYRHRIVEELYNQIHSAKKAPNDTHSKSLSLTQLQERTGINLPILKKQIQFLESKEIIKSEKKKSDLKWYLDQQSYFIDKTFLKERSVTNFDSYKRAFSYIGIPIALVVSLITLITRFPTGIISQSSNVATTTNEKSEISNNNVATNSLAVLPFTNISSDQENQYFTDGMHDDLLAHLSKAGGMKVISRTSVMQFKDTEQTIPDIAKMLSVSNILEGSVRKAGDDVKINVQLIEGQSDQHLWSEMYERKLTTDNIFGIQSEIAKKITEVLSIKIISNPSEQHKPKKYTSNLEAYENFLKARQLKETGEKNALIKAEKLLKEAIALDPNFSAAYANLGNLYIHLIFYAGYNPEEYYPKSLTTLKKSISLDSEQAEAYAGLGSLYHWWKRDYDSASINYEKALQLNPNLENSYYGYALATEQLTDQPLKAMKLLQSALEINPINPALLNVNANYLQQNRQFNLAKKTYSKGLEIAPNHPLLLSNYSRLFKNTGHLDSMAIINYHSIHENGKQGMYYDNYLLGLTYINLFDHLRTELESFEPSTRIETASKLYYQREYCFSQKDFNCVTTLSKELLEYKDVWKNTRFLNFEAAYFKKDYKLAISNYEKIYPSIDVSDSFSKYNFQEYNNLCAYLYCLKKSNQSTQLHSLNEEFRKILFDDSTVKSKSEEADLLYIKSLFLQMEGNSKQSIENLSEYLSLGNMNNLRWIKLDPIFEDLRNNQDFTSLLNKYDGLIADQQQAYLQEI